MSDFKTRLQDEKLQLDEKIYKLEPFLSSEAFTKIDINQQSLLNEQLPIMKAYSTVLAKRLSLLD